MKKAIKLVGVLTAVFALMFTVACGNGEKDNASAGNGGKTLTLGVWKGTEAENTTRKKLIADFEKASGIKVKEKVYNDYETQLQTDLVGGTAPDVFYVDAYLAPSLIEKKVLAPLDDYITKAKDFDTEDFYKPVYKAFTGEDKAQYGLPKDYSTLGIFYNEKMFADAGIDPNTIPTAADKMGPFLENLKAKLPKDVVPSAFTADLARQMYIAQSSGEPIITKDGYSNLDNPKIITALQPLVDWYQKGLIKRPADLGQDWSGDSFGAGKAAMMVEGNWAIAHLEQNFPDVKFGTKEVPTIDGKKGTMVFTVSYAMNAAAKDKDAAWELIEYFTGKTGMKTWAEGASVLPSRQSVAKEMNIESDAILQPFVAGAEYATPWQDGTTLSIVSDQYKNMLPSALKGEMTLKEAMKKATETANNDIKTQLKN
ncbi:ABC transporter substrate-binding protein [Listeria booriae]|uniref:ABC transporter substrate-binding protein n=1 Tax=Listeria booriae TaxID=1552123 RepID=UPI0016237869|nr:ABC transporter substrate-binding protein [Listeria booriae]MBC2317066.1 ABC transporter substrate-binding protein [Listeria booriae]